MRRDNFLFISDVHEPYSHPNALKFCKMLQRDFEIPHENVYSVGDLTDLHGFSRWPKSPDSPHTANQEVNIARDNLKLWAKAFPELKLVESNHDQRIMRKALGAELPSQVIKSFREIFNLPNDWQIQENFIISNGKDSFVVEHGETWCGEAGLKQAITHYGMGIVKGHSHVQAGVKWVKTAHQQLWGMDVGCLVDNEALAFAYGKYSKLKPMIGAGILLNGIPHFIPLV